MKWKLTGTAKEEKNADRSLGELNTPLSSFWIYFKFGDVQLYSFPIRFLGRIL